jgi:hypothetical protein
MMLDKSLLGPAPKTLQSVDIDFAGREPFAVIDFQVSVAAKHQAIIATELIGIYDAASAHGLDGEANQGLGGNIWNDIINPATKQVNYAA